MRTVIIKPDPCSIIPLGKRGENNVTEVKFDFTDWKAEFGEGAITLLVKRSGDTSAYPVLVSIDGTTATWLVSETDTCVAGHGEAEYVYTVNERVAKSAVLNTFVANDIGTAGDPPDPYESWLERLTELGTETQENAQAAEDAQAAAELAAQHYPVIIDEYWHVWSVSEGTYVPTGVKAEGNDLQIKGTVPTVNDLPSVASQGDMWNVGTHEPYIMYMWQDGEGWINQGPLKGPTGTTFTPSVSGEGVISWTNDGGLPNPQPANIRGEDGENGASAGFGTPSATVGTGTGTPSVSVSASGPDTEKVFRFTFDGLKGTPGVSPTVTVTDITGGHRVTITDATGSQSFDVMDGAGGGDILLVNITKSGNYYNADVSMTEIQSAYNAGKTVIAKWGSSAYLYDGSTFAKNVAVQPNEVTSQYFTRGSGYRLNYYSKSFFKPPIYYFWLNRDSSRLYSSDVTPAQFIQKDPLNETFTVVCNTVPSQGPSSGDEVYAQLRFDGMYHVYSTNPETGDPIEAIRVQFSGYDVDTGGTTSLMIAYVDLDILAENTSWYAYNAVVDYYSLM